MEDLETASKLIADAILKQTSPVKDDISERQAGEAYGWGWLRRMKEAGLADGHRIGGKMVYSRHQLDCLRAAERRHATLLIKSTNNTRHESREMD